MSEEPLLWVNGHLEAASAARIDPRDRGFTLGDGIFETMRAADGRVPWLPLHLARLRSGATVLKLPLPWEDAELGQAVTQTLAANGLREGVVRLTVSRGAPTQRGLLAEAQARPSLVIHAQPFAGYPAALYERGMGAVTSSFVRNERSPLTRLKTLSALENVLARGEAARQGADEAILCNASGDLASASAANLFLVREGALATPSVDCGLLPGTARRWVLERLAPRLGVAAVERKVEPEELREANEAFLTSALLGVMPLTVVDGKAVGDGVPGIVTLALQEAMLEVAGLGLSSDR